MTHDCTHHGHHWLEADGQPYARRRNRPAGKVSVRCVHCPATAELEGRAAFSGQRAPGQPIDKTIPPAFKKVLDAALTEPAPETPSPLGAHVKKPHGSVPKQP